MNGYDKIDRLHYNLYYLHLKSGTFVEMHRKFAFSTEAATELLNLNVAGKMALRTSEINTLKSFINKDNKNPTLRILGPLREPPSLVPSKFKQHEILFKAVELKIIAPDVYHVLQKTTMTQKELETIEKQIQAKEPKKKKTTIDWMRMSDEMSNLRSDIETLDNELRGTRGMPRQLTEAPPQPWPNPPTASTDPTSMWTEIA